MPRARFDKDYYRVMELSPDATEEEIRRAYRRLALQWHPDRNPGNPNAEERFKEISEAYAVLVDARRRSEYDAFRTAGRAADFTPNREDLFRDLFADARASAIFEELARELQRLGVHVDRRDFRQTLFGGRAVVTGHVFVLTPFTPLLAVARLLGAAVLRGTRGAAGVDPGRARETLPRSPLLRGLGRAARKLLGLDALPGSAPPGEGDVVLPLRLTREEAAHGTRKRVAVRRADGLDEMIVTVPAGVRAGARLRLKGKGRVRAGGQRGDAYLAVEIGE